METKTGWQTLLLRQKEKLVVSLKLYQLDSLTGEESCLSGLVVAAFGLSSEELAVLKILRPASYPMVEYTDNFDLLLTRRPICIVLNPLALDEGQQEQLNVHMFDTEGPDNPIFLVTQDAENILAFPKHDPGSGVLKRSLRGIKEDEYAFPIRLASASLLGCGLYENHMLTVEEYLQKK